MVESLHEDQLGWWEQNFCDTNTAAFRCISYISWTISSLIQTLSLLTVAFSTGKWPRAEKLSPLGMEPHFWGRVTWNHHQTTLPVKSMDAYGPITFLMKFKTIQDFIPPYVYPTFFVNLPPHTLQPSCCRLIHMSPSYSQLAGGHLPWTMAVEPEDCQQDMLKMFRNQSFQINPMRCSQENNRNFPSNLPKSFAQPIFPLISSFPSGLVDAGSVPGWLGPVGERIQPHEGAQGFTGEIICSSIWYALITSLYICYILYILYL